MSFLTEPLKSTLTICEKSYPINTDFRVWLKISQLTQGDELDFEKITKGIILCYKGGVLPPSFFEAARAMWDFLLGNEERGTKSTGKPGKRIFDFSQDAELIYASFLSDYGIDLLAADMHWHKFLTLFKNLSPNSPFMRVAAIRAMDPAEIKDPEKRREIIRKQRIFAIKESFDEAGFTEKLAKII